MMEINANTTKEILNMEHITKIYEVGHEKIYALNNVNLKVNQGEFISILGPSGSGKSTLMNIIGCLDIPTHGKYSIRENEVVNLNEKELASIRNREIGFIFQSFQLLSRLTALQNVELPLIYAGVPEQERQERAKAMLKRVGLEDRMFNLPTQLSGGQQQRVAIARAIVTEPSILLADEPTGALDQKTGLQIMELFEELNQEGRTVIMITHDENIAQYGNRIVKIIDGKIEEANKDNA